MLTAAVHRKRSADAQELRVVKAGAAARTLNLRMTKLDGLRHWWLLAGTTAWASLKVSVLNSQIDACKIVRILAGRKPAALNSD